MFDPNENPLASDSPAVWDRLIDAVNPASLLVLIESRLGPLLLKRLTPEDVLQEALLHAWRDRGRLTWHGLRSFRSWLLSIIDNRIRDLADREGAQKRGGDVFVTTLDRPGSAAHPQEDSALIAAVTSTTPSRVAVRREQAAAMRAALAELPDETREVLRLRLFEQLSMEETAARLSIGVSAARHRFRKGAEQYHARVRALLAESSRGHPPSESATRM